MVLDVAAGRPLQDVNGLTFAGLQSKLVEQDHLIKGVLASIGALSADHLTRETRDDHGLRGFQGGRAFWRHGRRLAGR